MSDTHRYESPGGAIGYRAVAEASGGGTSAALASAGRWHALAAAPTFAIMALLTSGLVMSEVGGSPDIPCMVASPLGGMALMYVLMSIFHAGPWLKVLADRRSV